MKVGSLNHISITVNDIDKSRAFYERQDKLFANGYVRVVGSPYPITKTLARQLGYDVDRLLSAFSRVEAGDDVEARDD